MGTFRLFNSYSTHMTPVAVLVPRVIKMFLRKAGPKI